MQRSRSHASRPARTSTAAPVLTALGAAWLGGLPPAAARTDVVALEIARLTEPEPAEGRFVGRALALDGDTLAVGAPRLASDPPGAVLVYRRSGATWALEAALTASDLVTNDDFGGSLALHGDTLAVGARSHDAPEANAGAVYVFERSGTAWAEQAKLQDADTDLGDLFGDAVLLVDADTLVIGARNADTDTTISGGAAYVFERGGTSWTRQARLQPSGLALLDGFGASLAASGDTLVVGAPGRGAGAAFVYDRAGGAWTPTAEIAPGDLLPEYFGHACLLDGDRLFVGAPGDVFADDGSPGAVYVLERSGTAWTETAKLGAPGVTYEDSFGLDLALGDGLLVVGAPTELRIPQVENGAVHVFAHSGAAWEHALRVEACDPVLQDFGRAVAFGDGQLVVGAPFDEDGAVLGRAYVHTLSRLVDVGNTFCFGDGSGSPCPCGNESTTPGEGCRHSGGGGMRIAASGSTSHACDDLVITAYQCPPGHTGIFFSGKSTFPGVPLYDGLQCVGGTALRFRGVFQTDGVVSDTDFVAQSPFGVYFQPAETYHWQYWSRDLVTGASPCGTLHNLSPAVRVTLQP